MTKDHVDAMGDAAMFGRFDDPRLEEIGALVESLVSGETVNVKRSEIEAIEEVLAWQRKNGPDSEKSYQIVKGWLSSPPKEAKQ